MQTGMTGMTGMQTGMQSQPFQQGGMGMIQQQPRQTGTQVFTLMPTNIVKFEKVETLEDSLKKIIRDIEFKFRQYDLKLEYSDSVIKNLQDNYKLLTSEGLKVVKCCKLVQDKKSKVNFLLQNLKSEIEQQGRILEKETKNYHILVDHPSMKITVPSDYFSLISKELEEKISQQIQQISDLEALVNLHYRKEYGSFQANSDLVEQTIKELYVTLIGLVHESAKIKEYVNLLKMKYFEMLKYNYGWKENEIENRFRHAMMGQEEKEVMFARDRANI
jgi:hypothetical protein